RSSDLRWPMDSASRVARRTAPSSASIHASRAHRPSKTHRSRRQLRKTFADAPAMIGSLFAPLYGDLPMEAVDVRGRFVWHELMTRDVPAAKTFYSKLTGWKTIPWPLDPTYTVCHADTGPVAGIMQIPAELPADFPPHWVQYIGTRDVDGIADAAVRAGGSLVKAPADMQGAGRYAVLKDPQGAAFAIIDPENARPEAEGPPPLGHFSWHELATSDNEAAFAFYSSLFGWEAIRRMDMGP